MNDSLLLLKIDCYDLVSGGQSSIYGIRVVDIKEDSFGDGREFISY